MDVEMAAWVVVLVLLVLGVIWLIAYLSHNRVTQEITTQAINKADAADLPAVLTVLSPRLTQTAPKAPSASVNIVLPLRAQLPMQVDPPPGPADQEPLGT